MEFPTGKKLFHSVVNPARYVEVPNRGPASVQTTRNVQTKNEVPFGNSNRENRPIFLNFPLFLGIFQWTNRRTKRVPFTAEPEIPEILSKWKAPKKSSCKINISITSWQVSVNQCLTRHMLMMLER